MKRFISFLLALALVILAGSIPVSAAENAYVYSFAQLKDALEDPNITNVYVYTQDNNLSLRGITDQEYDYAIRMVGIKNLHLKGRAVLRVQDNPSDDYVKFSSLIYVPAGASLTVDGEGSLDFDAHWANCVNAVIYNEGNLVIHNADLAGICSETKASACAIWHKSGTMTIHDGSFYGINTDHSIDHWGAVRLLAPATIRGGYFRSAEGVQGAYGLMIPGNTTTGITITGGTFRGIYLPTQTTPFSNYVPSQYTTLTDGQWFNPQSQYSQDYVRSAMVKVVNWIREINVSIKPPMEGQTLDYDPVIHTDGYYLTTPVWIKDGNELNKDQGPAAVAGASYKLKFWAIATDADSYEFASGSNLNAYVNGNAATISDTGFYDREDAVSIELDFGVCKNLIDPVYLSVTAPKELEKVRFTAGVTNTELCSVLSNVKWYENGNQIFSGAVFQEGKNYSVALRIKAKSGSEFPLDELGNPNVYCRVNGYDAEVFAVDGEDPTQVVEVRFDFGQCNDSIIEQIVITGITPPVPGEHPSYTATVQGSGYYVDTSKNSYTDAYWLDPAQKWYYVKNGVSWWDVTDGSYEYVYEHDVFLPGHRYHCEVYVHTESGYEFTLNLYTDPETWPTATLNGNRANITKSGSGLIWAQKVNYTFPLDPVDIESVKVTGLDTPVAGNVPDYTAVVDNPYLYEMDPESGHVGCGIWWADENDNYVIPGYHTFQAGQTYHMQMRVAATKLDSGELVGRFVDDVAVTVEGFTVDRVRVWDEVIIVDAYYTCPAASLQGGTITGSIDVPDNSESVTIQLIEEGTSEPAYEAFGRESYSFTNIPNGSYTMLVSKKNHVTRAYDITVTDSKVNVDVKLHLIGDDTGDGKVNMADVAKTFAHVRNKTKITDDYILACADTTGDTKVNMADVARIFAHVRGKNKLF